MRTRLSVCTRKTRFGLEMDALLVVGSADVPLRAYRCDRCRHWHLTSRTKGKLRPPTIAPKESGGRD